MIRKPHRVLAAAVFVAAAALTAACQAAPNVGQTIPPGAVYVSGLNNLFEQPRVEAPAAEAFTIYFDNREAVLHNVHVVDAAGASVKQGELFVGPSARPLEVPALAAGTYKLLCDVHPLMTAELVAVD